MAGVSVQQSGYVLLLVSIALLMLATATLALSESGSATRNLQRSQHDQFVLESGLAAAVAHNLAVLRDTNTCTGYAALSGSLGEVNYAATLSATSSSPVTLAVIATHSNGSTLEQSLRVPMYSSGSIATLDSTADSELDERKDDDTHGDAESLHVQISSNNKDERALFFFEVDAVPEGALVTHAELRLSLENNTGSSDMPDSVYRIRQAWVEDEVTWNRASNSLLDFWLTPGGTIESVPFATFLNSETGQQTVDLTQLVRLWQQGAPNYGVMLSASADPGNKHFHYASRESSDAAARPKLVVDYRCDCALGCV